MTGLYKINNADIFTAYGLMAKKGFYNELLKSPQRKEGYTKNWPDQNGTERDLGQVYFESRSLNLPFYLHATSEADFYSKYAALKAAILTADRFNFDVVSMNRRFKFLYQNMSELNKMTLIKNNNKIFVEMTIQVIDDFPVTVFSIPV